MEFVITYILIHAVLADRDVSSAAMVAAGYDFNPRGPCGSRPSPIRNMADSAQILIHAVLADRDFVL